MRHTTALKLVVFGALGLPMLRANAFLDINGVFTTIAVPGAQPGTTVASSINDLGQIAGWFTNTSGVMQGFVDTNGVFTTFSPPPYNGSPSTFIFQPVTGINDAGQVVGNYDAGGAEPYPFPYAFLYANGVSTELSGEYLIANGINDSGQVIFYGLEPPLFSNIGSVPLIYPGSLYNGNTEALGLNNAGEVVGVFSEIGGGTVVGGDFLWVNGTFTQINLPGTPSGINDSGQIVGNVGGFGYLDTNGIIQTIAVPGSTGTVAYGINDAGAIVGTFTPGFTPVPEPASLVLAAAGLIGIALLKRYRAAPRS